MLHCYREPVQALILPSLCAVFNVLMYLISNIVSSDFLSLSELNLATSRPDVSLLDPGYRWQYHDDCDLVSGGQFMVNTQHLGHALHRYVLE